MVICDFAKVLCESADHIFGSECLGKMGIGQRGEVGFRNGVHSCRG